MTEKWHWSTGALALVSALASCNQPVTRTPDPPVTSASVAPGIAAPRDVLSAPASLASGEWRDADALPPGATYRIGTHQMLGWQSAVADDGTIAAGHGARVVEIRLDGKVRDLPMEPCDLRALRYVGDMLVGVCGDTIFRRSPRGMETFPLACQTASPVHAISPSGTWFVCGEPSVEDRLTLVLYDVKRGRTARFADVPLNAYEVAVSDAGVVFTVDGKRVAAIAEGKVIWKTAGAFRHLGYDPVADRVVAWEEDDKRFSSLRAPNGVLMGRTPPMDLSVEREIQVAPDGKSWFVGSSGETTSRLVQIAPEGKVVASWPGAPNTHSVAVSPRGRFAVLAASRMMRVDLTTRRVSPALITDTTEELGGLRSTRSGDRVLAFRTSGTIQVFDVRAQKQIRAVEANHPHHDAAAVFSPDDRQVVFANRWGDLEIADGETLATRCRAKERIPSTWLYWDARGIVAIYAGMGDAASITFLDEHCKITKRVAHPGQLLRTAEDPAGVTLAFADAQESMLGPKATVKRLDLATRAFGPGIERVLEEMRAKEKADESLHIPEVHVSDDGRTTLSIVPEELGTVTTARKVTCMDSATRQVLIQHALPSMTSRSVALAGDGSWFAIEDEPTLVVYPCRARGPAR